MFVKRAKPGPARSARRSLSSGSEGDAADVKAAATKPGARRKLVAAGDEEEETPMFKVKKSKLSRQMDATKAPADVTGLSSFKAPGGDAVKRSSLRQSASGSRVPGAVGADGSENLVDSDDEQAMKSANAVSEPCPGSDGEDDEAAGESKAVMAARLARAQRAAARELGGAAAGPVEYMSLSGSKAPSAADAEASGKIRALAEAAQRELNDGEDVVDAGDAWAMRQMKVGAHRRYAAASDERTDANIEKDLHNLAGFSSKLDAEDRDGTSQVRAAAERVAKGHDGKSSMHEKEHVLLAPGVAMTRLWDSMKSLEGSAGDRSARTAELTSQKDDAQDQLREIEKQDKKLARALRTVQGLEELAWSLGGLLDAKAAKSRQSTTMLAQIEEDFVRKRSRRRTKELAKVLQRDGASLAKPQPDDGEEEEDSKKLDESASIERRKARRRLRQQRRDKKKAHEDEEGWETSDVSDQDGLEECIKDRSAFCAAAHKQIVADVAEEFSSASAVLKSLHALKEKLQDEYTQAFVHLALPEVFTMYVEHSALWWDPLQLCASGAEAPTWGPKKALLSTQLESFDWFEEMASFTELMGDDDPDAELVPKLVQQCIFPDVSRRIRNSWDVTSLQQSQRVAALLDECLLFEIDQTASTFAGLLESALERLSKGLEEHAPEVFVPNEALPKWYTSSARSRLLWRSCKIAHCACQLEGRLPDDQLAQVVLSKIFATRIAPHLKAPRLDPMEMAVIERFVDSLPERWLERGVPPMLAPIREALGPRAPSGPQAAATAEAAARILHRLRCFDEAQAIVDSKGK
eukprot:TRINITY_DN39947_c0_g1_i1.p1 TRINITY_DN39947_c0_g1~~TRINITY_DN39947_c0_g1_i1.p1  ORF type:complete len:806 (-),score=204.30 TRINITY_DN39947_c0_g1_i1:149-2566(-)